MNGDVVSGFLAWAKVGSLQDIAVNDEWRKTLQKVHTTIHPFPHAIAHNFRMCMRTKMCTHTNSLFMMGNGPKKTSGLWWHITILLKCLKTILLNLKTTGHMDIQIWNYLYLFFTFSKISVMSKLTVTLGFIFLDLSNEVSIIDSLDSSYLLKIQYCWGRNVMCTLE